MSSFNTFIIPLIFLPDLTHTKACTVCRYHVKTSQHASASWDTPFSYFLPCISYSASCVCWTHDAQTQNYCCESHWKGWQKTRKIVPLGLSRVFWLPQSNISNFSGGFLPGSRNLRLPILISLTIFPFQSMPKGDEENELYIAVNSFSENKINFKNKAGTCGDKSRWIICLLC